jgi:hypothetical protein
VAWCDPLVYRIDPATRTRCVVPIDPVAEALVEGYIREHAPERTGRRLPRQPEPDPC